jgi:hypothetical protein
MTVVCVCDGFLGFLSATLFGFAFALALALAFAFALLAFAI